MIKKGICLSIIFLSSWLYTEPIKVGLCIVATGKYIQFVPPLIESARKYFCPEQKVTYFVFTDGILTPADDIVSLPARRLGWPYDTMMRCSWYYEYREILETMDYVFALDADMKFVDRVGKEILSERVGTQHPGFVHQRGTYETRNCSTAYISPCEGRYYFAGGFHGGSGKEFIRLVKTMLQNIEHDTAHGITAIWHDESHLNRYFIDNPPTKILSPSYCYPESKRLPYHKRLLALDKNHAEMRK